MISPNAAAVGEVHACEQPCAVLVHAVLDHAVEIALGAGHHTLSLAILRQGDDVIGTALLRRRYRQILGPCRHFPKFTDGVTGSS
jgi:hypothetical protein